ncbi:hypothetical protein LLG10_06380 [bacterium]|nr:hypothetical protein [bacterium]
MTKYGNLLYLADEDDQIGNLITRLDCQRRMKTLRVKEKTVLYTLLDKGVSEREAAQILHLSRRYIRELKKSALEKLRGNLEEEF